MAAAAAAIEIWTGRKWLFPLLVGTLAYIFVADLVVDVGLEIIFVSSIF